MDGRFENFTVTILKLGKLVQKIKLFEMESYGLKAIHVMCIYFAGLSPVTAVELCRLTSEDKAAISRAHSLLKEKGYITYPAGAYNAEIRLTDEGKKLCGFINVRAAAAVSAAGKDLTEPERIILYKSLYSIASNLETYYEGLIKNGR